MTAHPPASRDTDDLIVRSNTVERIAQCLICDFRVDDGRVPTLGKLHVAETGHPVTIRSINASTWYQL